MGLQLPGTLVFDYPSVTSMAQYIHSLLAPAPEHTQGQTEAAGTGVPGTSLLQLVPGSAPLDNRPQGPPLITIAIAARLPAGYAGAGGEAVAGGADGMCLVPYGRWDLEALRVRGWARAPLAQWITTR